MRLLSHTGPLCLMVLLILSVAVVSCSPGSETPGGSPSDPVQDPTAAPTILPPQAGVLRIATSGAAPHRDLHRLVSEWATLFGPGLAYSRLLRFQTGPEVALPSMEVECDLCESWRIVNPRQYEFVLRADIAWQDAEGFSPRNVTAQDVVFSLERLRSSGMPHASLLEAVRTIEPVGERTVRILLATPDADLPQKLASPNAVILAPESLAGLDLRTSRVVGSGPWRYEQLLSGQVRLKGWEGYFEPGVPATREINVIPAKTSDGAGELLRIGGADLAQVTPVQWRDLQQRGFQSVVVPRQGRGIVFAMNTRRSPLDRIEVRRAIFKALDPWKALTALDGQGVVGLGVPVVHPSWQLSEEEMRGAFAAPAAARDEVRAADIALATLTLTVANFGDAYVRHGELLADQLRASGLDVAVRSVTRSEYASMVWRTRDFDLVVGPIPPVDTTNSFLLGLLHSRGASNATGLEDAGLDALLEEQAREADPDRRGQLVLAIQRLMLDKAVLFMPAATVERWAYGPRVQDFWPNIAFGAGDFWPQVRVVD